MNHWFFITRPEFWDILKNEKNKWFYRKAYDYVNIGDKAVILVSRTGVFTATIQITGPFRSRGGTVAFPFMTEIKYLQLLPEEHYIPVKEHLNELEIFKGKKGWGSTIQKSVLKIGEKDFHHIYNLIGKNAPPLTSLSKDSLSVNDRQPKADKEIYWRGE